MIKRPVRIPRMPCGLFFNPLGQEWNLSNHIQNWHTTKEFPFPRLTADCVPIKKRADHTVETSSGVDSYSTPDTYEPPSLEHSAIFRFHSM